MLTKWLSLKKASAAPAALSFLKTDLHSHVLPGIDDGSKTVEESVHYVEQLAQLGYESLVVTPHIYPDLFPNNRSTILLAWERLQAALSEKHIDMPIRFAAEYMVSPELDELVRTEPLLTLCDNLVLVEMSYLAPSPYFRETIFRLKVAGYQPVLAHPERYSFLHDKPQQYEELKEIGCLLQVNLLSLAGYYGPAVKKTARLLLKEKLADFAGTDLHHERHLAALQQLCRSRELELVAAYDFQNHRLRPF